MVPQMRVKICGITSIEDAKSAVAFGADAIGLVFYEKSPRYVSPEQAEQIARAVAPFVTVTALFVDAPEAYVAKVLDRVPVGLLQFHGAESSLYCERFSRPYLKALRVKPQLDLVEEISRYPSAQGVLLDTYKKGVPGGTGEAFNWNSVPVDSPKPIVLAGGLNPENISAAIATPGICGVDVSGGVESAPGIKDHQKVADFIRRAKSGENV